MDDKDGMGGINVVTVHFSKTIKVSQHSSPKASVFTCFTAMKADEMKADDGSGFSGLLRLWGSLREGALRRGWGGWSGKAGKFESGGGGRSVKGGVVYADDSTYSCWQIVLVCGFEIPVRGRDGWVMWAGGCSMNVLLAMIRWRVHYRRHWYGIWVRIFGMRGNGDVGYGDTGWSVDHTRACAWRDMRANGLILVWLACKIPLLPESSPLGPLAHPRPPPFATDHEHISSANTSSES